jgi:transcriptional regulator with XRE-family HTH domain
MQEKTMHKSRPLPERKYGGKQEDRGHLKSQLGAYVKLMRKLTKFSQADAAKRAGISRAQWNRIENGHDLPSASNILGIADALYLHPAALYTRAGYPIPEYEKKFDMEKAARDLKFALEKSTTLAGFIFKVDMIWQEYQMEYLKKNQIIKIDLNYAQVLASVISCLDSRKQLELARAIFKRYNKS